jgi:hypothetical protein
MSVSPRPPRGRFARRRRRRDGSGGGAGDAAPDLPGGPAPGESPGLGPVRRPRASGSRAPRPPGGIGVPCGGNTTPSRKPAGFAHQVQLLRGPMPKRRRDGAPEGATHSRESRMRAPQGIGSAIRRAIPPSLSAHDPCPTSPQLFRDHAWRMILVRKVRNFSGIMRGTHEGQPPQTPAAKRGAGMHTHACCRRGKLNLRTPSG